MNIERNYIPYHLHTEYSLRDSCDSPQDFIDKAVQNGMKAISFSEHGTPFNWCDNLARCQKSGIKYMHAVEIYLTENLGAKLHDNYHTVLIARNLNGVKEINRLISLSNTPDHFYGKPRISFDEFLAVSDNVITTSACIASPLAKLPMDHPRYAELVKKYTFLEIQGHLIPEQIAHNKRLYELSKRFGKPLIAATDTHCIDKHSVECRKLIMEDDDKGYDDSDLTLEFMNYDELVDLFKKQNSLPEEVFLEAIENTNLLYDMTEEIVIDTQTIKYPISYESPEKDAEIYRNLCWKMLEDKLNKGVIPREQEYSYRKAIQEELAVFEKLGMMGFMLSMSEMKQWVKANGMFTGFARGSVAGSRAAYVTDIIDLNPETWNTVFSRFCNENRTDVGDIDIDVVESERPRIFKYFEEKFGENKVGRVLTFSTLQNKNCIRMIGRVLAKRWLKANPVKPTGMCPYSIPKVEEICKLFESKPEKAREIHKDLFYYFDRLLGTKVASSLHAGGLIVSSISIDDNYGLFKSKEGEQTIILDMEVCHDVQLVKYDLLALKTATVIRDTCKMAGIPYPESYSFNWNDPKVWESLMESHYCVFQFEKPEAWRNLRKFKANSISDMSLITAAIRPSGASYRDELCARKVHQNPSQLIDELLKDNLGYLVYQEDIIQFLQQICGLSGSEADTVRRGIAKKHLDVLEENLPRILNGYCEKSNKPREIAEAEAQEFIQIIIDSSNYMFGKNHAVAYCMLSYLCAYYRYYYPYEFITAYLEHAQNDEDMHNGTSCATKFGITVTMPRWGISTGSYFFDKDKRIISKGVASLKHMNEAVADQLYEVAKSREFDSFMDVLAEITEKTAVNKRQLEVLIQVDYFSQFGNQKELEKILELFCEMFKKGKISRMKKDKIVGTVYEPAFDAFASDSLKSGKESKTYFIPDPLALMKGCEAVVKSMEMKDYSIAQKAQKYKDSFGYPGYITHNRGDAQKLYVMDIRPLRNKTTNDTWAYSLRTKSIGTGKESSLTIKRNIFASKPVQKDSVIFLPMHGFKKDREYFQVTDYSLLS